MPVRKFLELSTVHLTVDSWYMMKERPPSVIYDHPDGYGWFIRVPDKESAEANERYNADLNACFDAARLRSCDYILFDADSPIVNYLPTYEDP